MIQYLTRRMLLIIPTFFGTTFLVFVIISLAPGGPFSRAVMQLKQLQISEEGGISNFNSNIESGFNLSEEVILDLKKQYGLDKPLFLRYLIWLGLYKRELKEKNCDLNIPFREDIEYINHNGKLFAIQKWIYPKLENEKVIVYESGVGSDFYFSKSYDELPDFKYIIDLKPSKYWQIFKRNNEKLILKKSKREGIFTGDFGTSYVFDEPVLKLIKDRLHISCYFGFLGFIISYSVCIPLGIYKALKHGTRFDIISSFLIFIGYSIPGYVIGAFLLVYFGGGSFFDVFPLGGFVSDNWNEFTLLKKILDLLHHTFLPVLSYALSSFATLTVLMKNSIIDNLTKDYVRTAYAKGLNEKRILFVHILRNSLIPIATGIGGIIGVFLAGSYFIEKVFNINGIGMLSFKSIISADYPVVMGFLVLNTIILLIGNIISDFLYSVIDPKIRFE